MLVRWQSTIVDERGNIMPGAILTIRRESDQALVRLYRDRDAQQPYPVGTVTADDNGFAYFYVAPDLYRITSVLPVIDWRDVNVGFQQLQMASVTYMTYADMLDDESQPIPTTGQVVNDSDPENNGFYVWDGASWALASIQPVTIPDMTEAMAEAVEQATQEAEDYKDDAAVSAEQARNAAESSGPRRFYDTYAEAIADIANIPDGMPVEIFEDEMQGDRRSLYINDDGSLVFKLDLDYLKTSLAQPTGTSMIGWKAPYAGSVALTQEQVNNLAAPYLEMFGAVGDGATDASAAVQAAIDAGAKNIRIGAGRYRIDSDVVGSGNVTIEGSGPDTILDFYNGTGQIRVAGSSTELPSVSGPINQGDVSITFDSPPDIWAGDVFFVYDTTDFSWNGTRAYYRKGEFFRVHTVDGNKVNFYGGAADSYQTGSFTAHKVNPCSLNLSNLRVIESNAGNKACIKVDFGVGVRISNVTGTSVQYTAIELQRCYDFAITGTSVQNNSPSVGDEYGITISNCQNGSITGVGPSATRHAIAIGGGDYLGAVPCRYVSISGITLENFNTPPAGGGGQAPSGDLHSNSEFISYDNCFFKSGASFNGANNSIRNSQIFSMRADASGCCVYGSELVRGIMTLENCVLYVSGDGATGGQGFIRLLGGAALVAGVVVAVRNITVRSYAGGVTGANADIIRCDTDNEKTTFGVSIVVDGMHLEVPGATIRSIVHARSVNGSSPYQGSHINVLNVTGYPGGRPYLVYPHASLTETLTKEMSQCGEVNITTTASPIATVSVQNFPFRYSRRPSISVCCSSSNATPRSFIGTSPPIPIAYELNNEGVRPAIVTQSSSTNFASGETVTLHWRSGIRD